MIKRIARAEKTKRKKNLNKRFIREITSFRNFILNVEKREM